MAPIILTVSPRGQITIPKSLRDAIKTKNLICERQNGFIVLKPLKTREEFFKELEEAEKDWEKHGGLTWQEVMKKAGISK